MLQFIVVVDAVRFSLSLFLSLMALLESTMLILSILSIKLSKLLMFVDVVLKAVI